METLKIILLKMRMSRFSGLTVCLGGESHRAASRFHTRPIEIETVGDLSGKDLSSASEEARYDQVIGHYLAGAISLGRAAELLGVAWLELRTRLHRLGLPIHLGPENIEELRAEMDAVEKWEQRQNPRSLSWIISY